MSYAIFEVHFMDRTRCMLYRDQNTWEFVSDMAALEAARNQPGSEGARVDIFDMYGRRVMVVWF